MESNHMPDEPAVQPFVRDDPCLPCPEKDRGMNRNQGVGERTQDVSRVRGTAAGAITGKLRYHRRLTAHPKRERDALICGL